MNLTIARTQLATYLQSMLHQSISIIDHLPDSVTPPMVFVSWADPMIKPSTLCAWEAAMEIILVAQRIEPGGQYERLEGMISDIVGPMKKHNEYQVVDVTSPYPMQIGGVDYLAASINLTYDVEE